MTCPRPQRLVQKYIDGRHFGRGFPFHYGRSESGSLWPLVNDITTNQTERTTMCEVVIRFEEEQVEFLETSLLDAEQLRPCRPFYL
jgi:hypothetical protein